MKIFNVQFSPYFGQNQNLSFYTKERRSFPVSRPSGLNAIDKDMVSFGHDGCVTQVTTSALKSISDLPCLYCGEPMLSITDKSKIVQEGKDATGYKLVKLLMKNQKYLRRFKKDVASVIIDQAISSPHDNIQELLVKLAPDYIFDLEKKQMAVLRNLKDKYSDAFKSEEERKAFQLFLYETAQWIHCEKNGENGIMPFKIKTFYGELERILNLPIFRDRNVVKNIIADAHNMPQSTESESAFIVKYSKRSPREILEMLFQEATVTLEHIKPQMVGGNLENMKNAAVACNYCNGARRGHIPMDIFVAENPEIENNIKKQFDFLEKRGQMDKRLKHISNNQNDEMLFYISGIAQTYMRESKGKLNLKEYIIGKR